MVASKRTLRGLQDIRTLSGMVDQAAIPYRAYMRLSCLEMERLRRGKERESAMHRIGNIDARFGEIEVEKAALLTSLGGHGSKRPSRASCVEEKPVLTKSGGGFKLRY